jgi:hypothetical protein
MEHLITDKEFEETLLYYKKKYAALMRQPDTSPAEACVILLASVIDTALRVVFTEENAQIADLEERMAVLEGPED